MSKVEYIFRKNIELSIANSERQGAFDSSLIQRSLQKSNEIMLQISEFEVNIAEVLGMRNLSAFVGEVFAASVASQSEGLFRKNPHQDGYPDLLLMDAIGAAEYDRLQNNLQDKSPFSPFSTGGIEVKATVGSVPSPAQLSKKGLRKPEIGHERIDLLTGYDWKAHHRETNNLLGILWDFVDTRPTIVAVFYCSNLMEDDWGKIIQPKEGGGRTTSVSIMGRTGINKMYEGWLGVIADARYSDFLNKKNSGNLLPKA